MERIYNRKIVYIAFVPRNSLSMLLSLLYLYKKNDSILVNNKILLINIESLYLYNIESLYLYKKNDSSN